MVRFRRQSGYVVLAMLLVAFVSGTSIMFGVLNNRQTAHRFEDEQEVHRQLALAKETLLAYITNTPKLYNDALGPGYLPCPDSNNNGKPDLLTDSALDEDNPDALCDAANTLGRLPEYVWIYNSGKFPLNDHYQGIDEQFWYAVAPDHLRTALNTSASLKTDPTRDRLTLDGTTNIVALLIAPGAELDGQSRSTDSADYTNYLESADNWENGEYVASYDQQSESFNDIVLAITHDELINAISASVALEIKKEIDGFYTLFNPNRNPETNGFFSQYFLNSDLNTLQTVNDNWLDDEFWITNIPLFFSPNYSRTSPLKLTRIDSTGNSMFSFTSCSNFTVTISSGGSITTSGNACD